MKVLPPSTAPLQEPHGRRHQPPAAKRKRGYESYRECLRWEFGFTCAFCLLHEHDVLPEGGDGWGVWTIEHFVLQSDEPAHANAYSNCYWCCRRCNLSRDQRPIESTRGQLLDPCRHAWSDRFRLDDDQLKPRYPDDRDAHRTWSVYQLDDPGKVIRRKKRREALSEAIALWREVGDTRADLSSDDPSFFENERATRRLRRLALAVLLRYRAIPDSSVIPCECGGEDCRLPEGLEEQCIELPDATEPS